MEDARGQTVSVRIAATAADGRSAEFSTAGTVITFRGFLLAYEEGRDEPSGDAEEKLLPPLAEGDALTATALEPDGHSTVTASALHRGEPREGARGARDRPPFDVRRDHGDDPRPRLRAQAGPGARAGVPCVRGREAARESLRAARRLRVHGADGGRPRRDRVGRRVADRLAPPFLLRRGRRRRAEGRSSSSTSPRSMHGRSTPSSCRGRDIVVRVGPLRPLPRARRRRGRRCRPTSPPTS